jgi:phosphotransferase system HPr-like phosphotransfer protein
VGVEERRKENNSTGGDCMKKTTVLLGTINDVKEFVNVVTRFDFEVDLISGRYAVDAKSIMGIFSLDLSKPISVNVHSDDCGEFMAAIDKFVVKPA